MPAASTTLKPFVLFVCLTILGFIGMGDIHTQEVIPSQEFEVQDILWLPGLAGLIFGAVSGAIISSLQWIVLRTWAPGFPFWILFNAAGFGLAHFFNDFLPYPLLPLPLLLLVQGLIIALFQTLALRFSLFAAIIFFSATAIAWAGGNLLGIGLADTIDCCSQTNDVLYVHLARYGITGLVTSLVFGLAFHWIRSMSIFQPKDRASDVP
jgi:hypothetical protein